MTLRTVDAHTSTNAFEDPLRWHTYARARKNAVRQPKNVGRTFRALGSCLGGGVEIGVDEARMAQLVSLAAEAGLAVFQLAAASPPAAVEVELGGRRLRLPGVGPFAQSSPDRWIDAYCYARMIRSTRIADALVDLVDTVEAFRSFRGGASQEYTYRLAKAVAGFHRDERWWAGELEVARRGAESAAMSAGWWHEKMLAWIDAIHFLGHGDAARYDDQLYEHLACHRKYYEVKDHAHRLEGLFGLRAIGLAVMSVERGRPPEVTSGYMPAWIVMGDIPAFEPGPFDA